MASCSTDHDSSGESASLPTEAQVPADTGESGETRPSADAFEFPPEETVVPADSFERPFAEAAAPDVVDESFPEESPAFADVQDQALANEFLIEPLDTAEEADALPTPSPDGLLPAIRVSGNGVTIEHGEISPSLGNHTDFGVFFYGTEAVRRYTLHNEGAEPFVLDTLSVPAGFSLASPPGTSVLEPGASTTFEIRLDTAWGGTPAGILHLLSADGRHAPYSFAIRGTVLGPALTMTVSGNGIGISNGSSRLSSTDNTLFLTDDSAGDVSTFLGMFEDRPIGLSQGLTEPTACTNLTRMRLEHLLAVEPGARIVHEYTIHSHGPDRLALRSVNVPDGFLLLSLPADTIAPGTSTTFQVQLDTSTPGVKPGTVRIEHDKGSFSFAVLGVVKDPLAPEVVIEVLGNGKIIDNGASSPDFGDHTDFGGFNRSDDSLLATRTFYICSATISTLTLDAIYVPDGFVLTALSRTRLEPGEFAGIQIQLDTAMQEGIYEGDVRIHAGNLEEPLFTFAIRGEITAPQPPRVNVFGNGRNIINGVSATSVEDRTDFGGVLRGEPPVVHTFTVRNTGGVSLEFGPIEVPQGFTLLNAPGETLEPGESADFTVQLDTQIVGEKSGWVHFEHNAINVNPFSFRIEGVVFSE